MPTQTDGTVRIAIVALLCTFASDGHHVSLVEIDVDTKAKAIGSNLGRRIFCLQFLSCLFYICLFFPVAVYMFNFEIARVA